MERTISNREYWRMDRKMKMKYKPVSDGLILEYNLTNSQERASMQRGKEGQHNVFSYKELFSLYTCHYTKAEVINMLDK